MNPSDQRFWTILIIFLVIAVLIVIGVRHSAYAPGVHSMATTTESSSTASGMTSSMTAGASSTIAVYTYSCDLGKEVTATFHLPADDFVNLHLSDGRAMILSHVVSADGARYANADESFVFWTTGTTAFVQENGTTTLANCAVIK